MTFYLFPKNRAAGVGRFLSVEASGVFNNGTFGGVVLGEANGVFVINCNTVPFCIGGIVNGEDILPDPFPPCIIAIQLNPVYYLYLYWELVSYITTYYYYYYYYSTNLIQVN